ncbi:MAG: DUF1667 domain-containing protein [Promethearchaeota archaeon]
MTESSTDILAEIRCIICPTGCVIQVKKDEKGELIYEGYTCKRGLEYAKQEYIAPKRVLTTTMRVENGFLPLIPVRSNVPILKKKLNEVLNEIATTIIKAPIKMNDILIENVINLEANIIASRDLTEIK